MNKLGAFRFCVRGGEPAGGPDGGAPFDAVDSSDGLAASSGYEEAGVLEEGPDNDDRDDPGGFVRLVLESTTRSFVSTLVDDSVGLM